MAIQRDHEERVVKVPPKTPVDDHVIEKKALEIVQKAGSKGVLQSELWKHLNMNSREGSRVALRLEKQGVVRRDKELKRGRWTYRLYTIELKIPNSDDLNWDTLNDCPCFVCGSISACGERQLISPNKCDNLSEWIEQEVKKHNRLKGNLKVSEETKSVNL